MSSVAPIFILGMPRCRTAWLSFCLAALGVDCSHEGLRDHATFAEYAEELEARLAQGPAGDSDPGLASWLPEILERWPDARFAVIAREDEAALEATVRAAPMAEGILRQGWHGYLQAFKGACDRLRERDRRSGVSPLAGEGGAEAGEEKAKRRDSASTGARVRFWMAEQLADDVVVADVLEWLAGIRPSARWVRRRQRLKVTATIALPGGDDAPSPSLFSSVRMPLKVGDAGGGASLPGLAGFDTAGLSAAMVRQADFAMLAEWWQAHTGEALAQAALPPLGVLVSDAAGPCAAVWCHECFGVPVAELVFPVTRPGLSLRASSAALAYGIAACLSAAGQGHEPRAVFRFFKVFAPRPTVRFLKRLGFRECLTERTAMLLDLSWLP